MFKITGRAIRPRLTDGICSLAIRNSSVVALFRRRMGDIASTIVTATTGGIVALFTIVFAGVGRQQVADNRILQRAYVRVEPQGIEWLGLQKEFIGQVVFKNVGRGNACVR